MAKSRERLWAGGAEGAALLPALPCAVGSDAPGWLPYEPGHGEGFLLAEALLPAHALLCLLGMSDQAHVNGG